MAPPFQPAARSGGAVLVALLFWYTYGRDAAQRQTLIRARELARKREK